MYLPTVVIIDLGLPDGSGLGLIRDLAAAPSRIPVILATSAEDMLFAAAMAAGAHGVLTKPIESLAVFQKALLDPLPFDRRPRGLRLVSGETVAPDPIAYRDDLARIADLLTTSEDDRMLDYVAQFLTGVARSAHDHVLEEAACDLALHRLQGGAYGSDLARVAGLLQDRLETRAAI